MNSHDNDIHVANTLGRIESSLSNIEKKLDEEMIKVDGVARAQSGHERRIQKLEASEQSRAKYWWITFASAMSAIAMASAQWVYHIIIGKGN